MRKIYFSFYWPLFLICLLNSSFLSPKKLIMIDPAGDARNIGRKLVEGYERGVTLQFAESLKKLLSSKYGIQVILTRTPGEVILPFQNASFANRLGVDFFLSLHVYREEEPKPKVFVYNLVYNPLVDLVQSNFNTFQFLPIHQAHFKNINKTVLFANMIKEDLTSDEYKKQLNFYGPFGIPVKPIVGIVAPAILLEVGICEDNNWKYLLETIAESIGKLV